VQTPHRSNGQLPAELLKTSTKQRNSSVIKVQDKATVVELKQDAILNPELFGSLLQRELARLNLNVLRTMARMLEEQEQKFSAERNTLRASGRMLRAEMRRAVSETAKINSERQKLDLERDVLQSQLLARRRSARLLDLLIKDYENGRKRTAPDINRLYVYSRGLGGPQAGHDLGQQLEDETNMLDQQRFYLQSLMQPRWHYASSGELFPVDLTRMHPSRIPSSEVELGRDSMVDGALAWDWPQAGASRETVAGGVASQAQRFDRLQGALRPEQEDETPYPSRATPQLHSAVANQQIESDGYLELYDDTNASVLSAEPA
jgi:hypothetical protein